MDWLTRLPVIGPWATRLMRTHAWRAYEHLDAVHWTRLAAAVTFTSFVALFPLLTVGAAVGAALLTPSQLKSLEDKLSQQVPGIADQLNIEGLVANAGTVGLIAGILLLLTGIGWVGSLRECLRVVWEKEEDPGNPVLRRLADAGVLLGLGAVALVSVACSAFATSTVGWAADRIGLDEHGPGRFFLGMVGVGIAVVVDFVLITYLLTWLPRVTPARRALLLAGLIGAVGFELLKVLLSGYLQGVATKSMYGAFGVPVALLLWINFIAKLMLYCASWTATQHVDGIQAYEQTRERRRGRDAGTGGGRSVSAGEGASAA